LRMQNEHQDQIWVRRREVALTSLTSVIDNNRKRRTKNKDTNFLSR
jgi:hypothetical protein